VTRRLALLFLAIPLAFIASCSTARSPILTNAETTFKKPPSLRGGEWLLTDLPGTTVVLTSLASFTVVENNRAAGYASCNRFSGAIEINGSTVKFGAVVASLAACGDPALTSQEAQFLRFLKAANHFDIQEPFLLLYADGYDQPLHFSRIP
jgi:heat shock protein HslJ